MGQNMSRYDGSRHDSIAGSRYRPVEAAYVEIVDAAPGLPRLEAFVGFYKMLGSGLKQANQAQIARGMGGRDYVKEILKIAQCQLGEWE